MIFTFDPENWLRTINGTAFTAQYDGDGMRTTLTINTVTTYYLYDDEAGGVPVAELSTSGTTTSLSALNGLCADGWRLRYVGGVAYVETYDPQGSIVESSLDNDALGSQGEYAVSVFVYDGFGALRGSAATSGSSPAHHKDPAGFGGEWGYYQDLQTGLEHLGARYYDGGTGRFVTRDPIGYGGGENLYAFCHNNPINRADPSGLDENDAEHRLLDDRSSIKKVAKENGIQPELLAGVVFVEAYAGGFPSWNVVERQTLSVGSFILRGHGDLGITKFNRSASPSGLDAMNPVTSLLRKYLQAEEYDADDYQNLEDAAKQLRSLASAPNRYPTHVNNLTPWEMGVILTNYNKGATSTTAAQAIPSVHYGRKFLDHYNVIEFMLNDNGPYTYSQLELSAHENTQDSD